VAAYGQRAADTKAEGRNEIAAIRASRKTLRENHTIALDALKRAHAAELAALDDQEAAVRCETEERVAVNRRLAAASRAALAALEAE
jgi:hypothetical protein